MIRTASATVLVAATLSGVGALVVSTTESSGTAPAIDAVHPAATAPRAVETARQVARRDGARRTTGLPSAAVKAVYIRLADGSCVRSQFASWGLTTATCVR